MTVRRLLTRPYGVAVLTVALGFVGTNGRAADDSVRRNRPIEISTPTGDNLITNVNQLGAGSSLSPVLEESLSMPAQMSYQPKSFQRSLPPPSGGIMIMRPHKGSSVLDLGPGWSFGTQQEMMEDILAKGFLKPGTIGTSVRDQQDGLPSDNLYRRMFSATAGKVNPWAPHDRFETHPRVGSDDDSSVNGESSSSLLMGAQRSGNLSKTPSGSDFNSPIFSLTDRPSGLSDIFGLGNSRTAGDVDADRLEKKAREKAMAKDYQVLLDGVSGVAASTIVGSVKISNPWLTASPSLSKSRSQPSPLLTPMAALPGSMVDPALIPPKSPLAPVPSSLAPVPYVIPPSRIPPPKPVFFVPRRAF